MSQTPRGVSARQLVRALEADGFALRRSRGSHRIFSHPDGRRIVVAYHHPGDTFPIGTLKGIIHDAGGLMPTCTGWGC